MNSILITAIGKRVQLIRHLKEYFKVVGTDTNAYNPASKFVDKFYEVPKYYENNYINSVIDICNKENIKLLIPLYEKEFDLLCRKRNTLENLGVKLLLSDSNIINICNDKLNTYTFFKKYKILTPEIYSNCSKEDAEKVLPIVIKPIDGMGSKGVYIAKSYEEMCFFKKYVENSMLQKFVSGTEYTIDVLCDFDGNIISAVPRQRIEVIAGEVSKSKTIKDDNIISKTKQVIEALNKEGKVIGPITVQCILNKGNPYFIEINCRFGGGVPLTFEAGVNYSYYLSQMINGNKCDNIIGDFKEITMLRYDEAVFL